MSDSEGPDDITIACGWLMLYIMVLIFLSSIVYGICYLLSIEINEKIVVPILFVVNFFLTIWVSSILERQNKK